MGKELLKLTCKIGKGIGKSSFNLLKREFQEWWRWRQRERQNSIRLIKQNSTFAPASRFFVHVFVIIAQPRCENA